MPMRRGRQLSSPCPNSLSPSQSIVVCNTITVRLKISRLVIARPGSWVQEGWRNPTLLNVFLGFGCPVGVAVHVVSGVSGDIFPGGPSLCCPWWCVGFGLSMLPGL